MKNKIDITLNVPLNDVIAFVLLKTESFDNVEEVDLFFLFFFEVDFFFVDIIFLNTIFIW